MLQHQSSFLPDGIIFLKESIFNTNTYVPMHCISFVKFLIFYILNNRKGEFADFFLQH